MSKIETTPIDSLTIIVREYRDKTYGNTYYSAAVVANGQRVHTFTMTYGHGDLTVLNRTNGVLRELGFQVPAGTTHADSATQYEYSRAGIPLTIDTVRVTRRKDLHVEGAQS